MRRPLLLGGALTCCLVAAGQAQDAVPDLTGTWRYNAGASGVGGAGGDDSTTGALGGFGAPGRQPLGGIGAAGPPIGGRMGPVDPDARLFVCYSDVVFRRGAVTSLRDAVGDVVIAVDSTWRARYDARGRLDLESAEKVRLRSDAVLEVGAGVETGPWSVDLYVKNLFDVRGQLSKGIQCREEVCGDSIDGTASGIAIPAHVRNGPAPSSLAAS